MRCVDESVDFKSSFTPPNRAQHKSPLVYHLCTHLMMVAPLLLSFFAHPCYHSNPSLPQGGSEKLFDEAIDASLDKVVKLLAYLSLPHSLLTPVLTLLSPLSQGGSEKLSDEAIDETLDKVVKLLAYYQCCTCSHSHRRSCSHSCPPSASLCAHACYHSCSCSCIHSCLHSQGGSEKLSDEAIDETLDKVVKLLAYISDKDLFAEFYRKRLARRLLQVCNLLYVCASFCESRGSFMYALLLTSPQAQEASAHLHRPCAHVNIN